MRFERIGVKRYGCAANVTRPGFAGRITLWSLILPRIDVIGSRPGRDAVRAVDAENIPAEGEHQRILRRLRPPFQSPDRLAA